ncbi:hypothetical protein LKW27_13360 [Paracidovorax citrulli]|nr:hypothetical protein LKW27_13360 [Paracidovorax citrulli]
MLSWHRSCGPRRARSCGVAGPRRRARGYRRRAGPDADARARVQDIFERQLRAAVRRLAASAAEADMRAALIASQMLGFALVRYVLEFSARGMSRQKAARAMGATLQRYLVEPI